MSFCSSPWLQAATVARRAASSMLRVMASLSRNVVYDRWTTPRAGPTPADSLPARTCLAGPQKYRGKDQGTAMSALQLETKLSPDSDAFRANADHNRALDDRLRADAAPDRRSGGEGQSVSVRQELEVGRREDKKNIR